MKALRQNSEHIKEERIRLQAFIVIFDALYAVELQRARRYWSGVLVVEGVA